jgi:hypothetical protein
MMPIRAPEAPTPMLSGLHTALNSAEKKPERK